MVLRIKNRPYFRGKKILRIRSHPRRHPTVVGSNVRELIRVRLKKNDERTKQIARMGAIAKNKLYPEQSLANLKKVDLVAAGRLGHKRAIENHPDLCSRAGKVSRVFENEMLEEIKERFAILFKPNEVCDAIGVKDDEIVFIEIKKPKLNLRPKQKQFASLITNINKTKFIRYP